VLNLIVGRGLDQLHRSSAPRIERFDPKAGAALITNSVKVVIEVAVTLQQTEALGRFVAKCRRCESCRRIQGAPNMLSVPGPQRQTVRVMHLGSPIDARRFYGLGEPVHGSKRGDPQSRHIMAKEQARLNLHSDVTGSMHHELIGARDARAFEHRIDRYFVCAILGRLEVKPRKGWKFLGSTGRGEIDRYSPCRDSVLEQFADGPKVGGAEKGDPIVVLPRALLRIAQAAFLEPKTGKSGSFRQ